MTLKIYEEMMKNTRKREKKKNCRGRATSPGMKSMLGLVMAVPPVTDRWECQGSKVR